MPPSTTLQHLVGLELARAAEAPRKSASAYRGLSKETPCRSRGISDNKRELSTLCATVWTSGAASFAVGCVDGPRGNGSSCQSGWCGFFVGSTDGDRKSGRHRPTDKLTRPGGWCRRPPLRSSGALRRSSGAVSSVVLWKVRFRCSGGKS